MRGCSCNDAAPVGAVRAGVVGVDEDVLDGGVDGDGGGDGEEGVHSSSRRGEERMVRRVEWRVEVVDEV